MSDAAAAAEEGFFRRLSGDLGLWNLLGSGTRIHSGWPGGTLTRANLPRLTYYTFGPPPRRPGFQRIRVTVDEWVWSTGASGGRSVLLAVDARLMEMFDEQHWSYQGVRMYSTAGGFRDSPAPPNRPMRRTREIVLDISPLG